MATSELNHADRSDPALIQRTRSGDTEAYAELHERHLVAAKAAAWRMSRSPADADDLVAEGFAKVLSAIQNGGGPDEAFRPYLLTTIRRLAYDRTKRERRETPTEDEIADESPAAGADEAVVEDFERSTASEAFAGLPERWRMVLWHTEVEGQSTAEVADLLGIKPNAVAALAYRAREGLRQAYLGGHVTVAADASITCRRFSGQLGAYTRGGISPAKADAVAQHLETCDDCRSAYMELLSVNSSLGAFIAPLVLGAAGAGYFADMGQPAAHGGSSSRAALPRGGRLAGLAAVAVMAIATGALAGSTGDSGVLGASADARPSKIATAAAPGPTGSTARQVPYVPTDTAPTTSTTAPAPAAPTIRPEPRTRPAPSTGGTNHAGAGSASTPTADGTGPATPTTTAPEPHLIPSAMTATVRSAGALVDGRPGVLIAKVANDGAGAAAQVTVAIEIDGATLRGAPSHAARSGPGPDWTCTGTATAANCSAPAFAAGDTDSIYLPVTVPTGAAVTVKARAGAPTDGASAAAATVTLPTVPSGMAARYAAIEHGGIATAGNTLLTCPVAAAGCAEAQSGAPASNDSFAMTEIDVDSDATTSNSSISVLDLPAGARVLSAQIYWSADLAAGPSGHPADAGRRSTAVLTGPAGAASTVTAERIDEAGSRYQAVADVTGTVTSSGPWTLGGVAAATGNGRHAGWSLVVAYSDPASPLRSLVVLDGFSQVSKSSSVTFDVGGFVVPSGRTRATIDTVVYEGDSGISGDQLSVAGSGLADAANPLGNTFNSSAGRSRTPGFANLLGLDLDRFEIGGLLSPGSTSTTVEFSTDGDVYLPGAVAIAVDQ